MTERKCFTRVEEIGDAIEALASALDPQREPPFKGDILDLLEWAEKDVKAMRAEIERLKTVPMKYRRMAFNAQLQDENAQLSQQLTAVQERLEGVKEQRDVERAAYLNEFEKNQVIVAKNAQLRQHVALLREKLDTWVRTYPECAGKDDYVALAATKEGMK